LGVHVKIPRYPFPEQDIATTRYPTVEQPSTLGNALVGVSQLAQTAATIYGKKKELDDANMIADRYMAAVTDMEAVHTELQRTPDSRRTAKQTWAERVTELSAKWTDGLDALTKQRFDREIFPKVVEYKHKATVLQDKQSVDEGKAGIVQGRAFAEQSAADLSVPDHKAFEFLYTQKKDGAYEYGPYYRYLKGLASAGLIGEDDAEREFLSAQKEASYARAQRLATLSPRAYVDTSERESVRAGSTFLRFLDANKRNELDKYAYGRIEVLDKAAIEKRKQQEEDLKKRQDADEEEADRRVSVKFRNRDLDRAFLDDLANLRLLKGPRLEHWYAMLEREDIEGGPGEPRIIREYMMMSTALDVTPSFLDSVDRQVRRRNIPYSIGEKFKDTARKTIERSRDRALDMDRDRHGQAQALADSWLTTNSPSEKLDQLSANLKSAFRQELLSFSKYYNPEQGEDALEFAYKRLPFFIKQLTTRNKEEIETLKGLITFKDEKELLESFKHLTREQALKNPVLQTQIEYFRKLRAHEEEDVVLEDRAKGGVGTTAPTKPTKAKPKGPAHAR
jgi:hypothetical protein